MVQLGKRPRSSTASTRAGGDSDPFSTLPDERRRDQSTAKIVPLGSRARSGRDADRATLREELSGMAASLADIDPRAARRLQSLADAIDGTPEDRLRWADVDLRRAFNTEHLAYARAVSQQGGVTPRSIDYADKLRNMLVFLPIFLTWFALFESVRAYRKYVDAHPDEIRQPFLLLWQRGFGSSSGFLSPSFSNVAIIDAVLIAMIIGLTFYVHGRREAREDAINVRAQDFQRDLDNLLAEATVELSPDRGGRPAMLAQSVRSLAERFETNSQELLTRLQVEHDRLEAISSRREKEFADFGVFASGMRAGAEETHKLLLDLRQVSNGLTQALEDLTSEVGVSADQQRSLFTAVTSLERLVATGIQSDHGVTRQLSEAAQTLADAADKSLAGSEAAAQAGRVASEAVRGIADLTHTLIQSQARVEAALANETETNSRLADALRGGMTGVNASAKTLGEIQVALGQLRHEFTRIADLSTENTQVLSRVIAEQNTISAAMSQAARELGGGGQRHRDQNEDFSALIRRLDQIANQLARATGTPPEPSNPSGGGVRSILTNAPDFTVDTPESPGSARGRGLWPRREP